ncbi:ATP-binding cassette domain-containing protein [Schaalia meyeri]|uniref:UvrABC system protein A n=1 Tax=Schaalia meyeri TaxID=52773 RepID=A0AAQ0BW70_9ACTO|nr:ATP-binding cassette domain-containing protein [Schaalia meyeri]QQC44139.1 ATP-binding cassette domain-containing protein [Schaalia meyeri]SDR68508.1 excinuclease ABC subunit A [Schaalia meyeri]
MPSVIRVRGARVHNLKNVDVDVPLNRFVAIAGVSGSGKSSLALGTLYAEGSRRYLESLATYTRRRISQAAKASVDEVIHVPAALALRQRPGAPGVRSTFGTATELANHLRLLFSRVGSYLCPSGHRVPPSRNVALEVPLVCPQCSESFYGLGAEEMAFNSAGACPVCEGTGIQRVVDRAALVPDESRSIDEGAVSPWGSLMWKLMKDVAREMGVRTDVPFRDLSEAEKAIVYEGPAEKHHIVVATKTGGAELDFTYFNAVATVENALAKAKDEKALARVGKYLITRTCPACEGTRLGERVRSTLIDGIDLGQASRLSLAELREWVARVPGLVPGEVAPMARVIVDEMAEPMKRLADLGLSYLSLDRASSTLSNGERQRVQLARAVRNRTTGVLYVLDEPTIGLHPSNVDGVLGIVRDLIADGNSAVVVDHDTRVLAAADHLIEIGPGAGADGGRVIFQGPIDEACRAPASRIGPYLAGSRRVERPAGSGRRALKAQGHGASGADGRGAIHLETERIHTVHPLNVDIPVGALTAVTGVSGSGKTTMVLESLVPALRAALAGEALPGHVRDVDAAGISRVHLIDATPIGVNVRSTVATYCGVLDELRRAFARTEAARAAGLKAGAFSYNTGSLRCPTCEGTGQITLDVQFLPDVDVECAHCRGSRYSQDAGQIRRDGLSLPDIMAMSVDDARGAVRGLRKAGALLDTLSGLGLGYLTLGEATPALSGGEAQRLKLASEMGRRQEGALFVFDEPTIGLHPEDVQVLLDVLQRLIDRGATVVVIEHDLDVIANSDWVIDMGPGGGALGGRVVACGTARDIAAEADSVTGRYLR